MNNKVKKIISIICLVLLLLSTLPLQAFAVYLTDINSNAQFGVISGSLSEYGHELHYANYDGQTYLVFCTQYGVKSPNGDEYVYNGNFIVQYKNSLPQYEKIAEIIYFGYTMNYGTGLPTTDEAKRAACCTQQYVWEYIHNNIDGSYKVLSRDSWNGSYMSSSIFDSYVSQAENYYNLYHGTTSFNGQTAKVSLGNSTTITDTNGKLSAYGSFSNNVNGITFYHNQGSNDLTITASADCSADNVTFDSKNYGLYQLMPDGSAYNSSTMSNYVYIQFTAGNVQNVMFSNYVDPSSFSLNVQVEYGNTLLIKTNSVGNNLADCKFGLYKDENCTQQVRTGTSNSDGQIFFQRLVPGTYYVKELSAPNGYLIDNEIKSVNVNVNETAQVSFQNNEPTGEIKITKTDKELGTETRCDEETHHGDANLNGTEYTLYADEDIYNVAKTVKYFSKDEEIATYSFDSKGNATINITTKSTSANLSYDGNTLKGLPMGNYYAKETKTPEGYIQDTEKHSISLKYKDMNTSIITNENTFTNQVEKAKFEVIKISSNTNDTADVVDGAEFTAILTKYVDYYGSFDEALKHINEYSNDEYSIFKTANNGHGISNLLAYGKYTVRETYCPSDKINPVKDFNVNIDKNSTGVIKKFIENDTPFQSYIKMIKVDKKTGKQVTLSNATFSLYKLNETTNEWEKVSCKLGKTSFDKWTTDENAIAYTETKLDAGTYKVEEIETPTGFLELEGECIFKVNRSNDTLEYDKDYDAYISVKVENEQPTGTLEIEKSVTLNDNVDTSLIEDLDLSKIEFELKAKEDVIDYADGEIIYNAGDVVKSFNLSEDGTFTIENLPMGKYILKETKTIDGLVLDENEYEVEFSQEDNTTKVYTISKSIVNKSTITEFSKVDITGGNELIGANLKVIDEDGNVIDEWVSSENTHKIEGLVVGKTYKLVETIAPYGYEIAESIDFKVENKEMQKVVMKDMPILKNIRLNKIDSNTKELIKEKFSFGIYEDEECTKLIKEIESDKDNGYVEFDELRYGTYYIKEINAPKGYQISDKVIKIEISDKGVFADGVELTENDNVYCFDFENEIIEVPNTGDDRHIILFGCLGAISAIALAGMGIYDFIKRRKNKKIRYKK